MITDGRRITSLLGLTLAALSAFFSLGILPGSAGAQVSALPLNFSDVAIFATNSVRIDNSAHVTSGHVVVNNASSGPTLSPGVELGISNNAQTPTGYAIVADSISISNGAVVGGNAFFNTLSNSGTINGAQNTPLALPVFSPLPTFKSAPPGTLDVTVPNGTVQTVAAGNYRDIKVLQNATLRIDQGVTNVRSITVANGGKLLFLNLTSGPTEVRVAAQMTVGNNFVVGPVDSDPLKAGKIIFYVASPSLMPVAVDTGTGGTLYANVYAPNGTLILDNGTNAVGAFLANNVDVQNGSHVALESFFTQQAPTITSANATTFTVGQAGSFTVTTTGSPTPSIARGGVALPSGVSFVDNGNGTGTLSGTPAAGTGGTYAITFTASNGVPPDAVQNFTLTVNQAPAITSANATTFTVGQLGSFTVTTNGFPPPSITRGGVALPPGVSFVDNGNGTGTLSGTPAAGTGGTYAITFTATNTAGSSPTQNFTLTVNQAPTITSANTTTFTVGQLGSFTVTTNGFPAPSITRGGVALPPGVNFVDNGNGTGTLSGTPAAGTGGAYAITFTATNTAGSSPTQNFTLNVNEAPTITSANTTTFTVGQFGSFTVTTSGFPPPSIARGGVALPSGVTFTDNGNGTGTLSGTPAAGTGGTYAITFIATNTAGSSPTQNFTLTVNQAPAITSANATTFIAGQFNSFTVTATGFPTPSITRGGVALPANVTYVDNGNGTGTLSGTPLAGTGGSYALTFTASNGVPPNAFQNFTLSVAEAPTAVNDGPYVTDANTTFSRATSDPDDLLDNDARGFPLATITSFGGGSLGGTVTSNAAGATVGFGTGGSLTVQSNGAFSFTPSTGFTGVFTFQYRLSNVAGTSDATVTIDVRPKAVNDTFGENVVGNVVVDTSTGTVFSILTNDVFNGTPTVNTSGTSAQGGSVTVSSGGTFVYNPPVGYEGPDSFTYTITDSSGFTSTPATVSLTVSGMIWFVNNNAGSCVTACDGRETNPFTTLQGFTSVNDGVGNHPANNDNIFAYESAIPYTFVSGTLLRTGQKLIGQDATATLASIAGVTPPSGSTLPAMNTGGNATTIGSTVPLATNSTVRGLSISTGVATGLSGGAVSGVSTSEVIVTTTAGTAVNLNGTGGTVSLISVSANGGANGIVLQNTTGSFAVNGDGVNTSVGGNGSGGTIANMSGADGTTAGIGVYLNNVQNVTLRRMTINGTNQNYGIRGNQVNGFTLEFSTVSGTNGTAAALAAPENAGEGSIYFGNTTTNGLSTSGTFTKNVIQGGRARNLSIINTTAGTTVLTIKGNTFGLNQNFADANQSLLVEARNSGTVINSTVGGTAAGEPNTFTGSPGDLVNFTGQTGTTMDVVLRNNALSNSHAQNVIGGGGMTLATQGTMTFNVDGNTLRGADGSAVTFQKASAGVLMSGIFNNNGIGVTGVVDSGSKTGNGIFVSAAGTGTISLTITNNDIRQYAGNGAIFADNTDGSYTANFTITGNTAAEPGSGAFTGLALTNGAPSSSDTVNVCADIKNNDFSTGDPADSNDILLGASGAAAGHTFNLPGYVGTTTTDVQNFVRNNNLNPGTTAVTAYTDPPVTDSAFTGSGTNCPTP